MPAPRIAQTLVGLWLCIQPLGASHTSCSLDTEIRSVGASMTVVMINEQLYQVQGYTARTAFREALVACGHTDAAFSFQSWRRMRRLTNITLLAGIAFPPIWIASGVYGVLAGTSS